jgi:hypothetical protein
MIQGLTRAFRSPTDLLDTLLGTDVDSTLTFPQADAAAQAFRDQFKKIAEDGKVTREELSPLVPLLEKFKEVVPNNFGIETDGLTNTLNLFTEIADKQAQIQKLEQSGISKGNQAAAATTLGVAAIRDLSKISAESVTVGQTVKQQLELAFKGAAEVSKTQTDAIVLDLKRIGLEAQNQVNSLKQTTGQALPGRMKGGMMDFLAAGGQARGTDTIAAMLSPGEFVMNARSSRKFFPQLVAMNAGVSPAFRADGGSVTNVTIGDVVVQNQGGTGRIGRTAAAAIQREIRRGTSKPF